MPATAITLPSDPKARTLLLLDACRTRCPHGDLDPDLAHWGVKEGLIRLVNPAQPGGVEGSFYHLTALALEQSILLRDAGSPLLSLDITQHGLRITRELSQSEWRLTVMRLRQAKEAYHTCLGDLLDYGRQHFGTKYVDEQIQQLEFPFEDITHAESIARVPRLLREASQLTSEHYYILGLKFPQDNTSQELWANRAAEHKLSPLALRRSIERGEIITDTALTQLTGHGSGIPVLQGMALPFVRWIAQVGGLETVKTWDTAKRAAVLQEITPIVNFALELRETIED